MLARVPKTRGTLKNRKSSPLAKLTLILILLPVKLLGNDADVSKVTVKTRNGLLFSVWVNSQSVSDGQDIVLNIKVTNHSTKTIYLVQDNINTSKFVDDRNTIVIPEPLVLLGGHESYDYTYTKVAKGKTYVGRIVIAKDDYKIAQPWPIEVGFGYVNDITGLNRPLGHLEDPAPLKGRLRSRLETLQLCGIRVDVKPSPR